MENSTIQLKWLGESNPYIIDMDCHFDPNDFYDSGDEQEPECLPHNIVPKEQLGDVLLVSGLKCAPKKPSVSNSHIITPYKRKRPKNGEISPSTGVVYQYIKDLMLRDEYDTMIALQRYKLLPYYNNIPASKLVKIARTFKQDMGFLITVYSNMKCFVCFVVKDSLAHKAGIRFGDQILEIDYVLINKYIVLDRLVMSPSFPFPMLIRENPFFETVRLNVEKGITMGFNIADGQIHYVKADSSAQKNELKVENQIIEINRECAIGWPDAELERQIRNAAVNGKNREVELTVMPRSIYLRILRRLDPILIRRRAELKF